MGKGRGGVVGAARKERTPGSVPCGGRGWEDGLCFDCQLEGADYCALRDVPRVLTLEGSAAVVLRLGAGRRARRAMRRGWVGWG